MRLLIAIATCLVLISGSRAEIVRSSASWLVDPPFGKSSDAREALSGAVCIADTKNCIAVFDEKKYAQFFWLGGRRLTPANIIRLLPGKIDGLKMDEIDAEGVAYVEQPGQEAAHLYVVGSHGLSRRTAEFQPSRFFLFRFPVDPATGLPKFEPGDHDPGPEIQRTAFLRETLRDEPVIGPYAEQRLDRNGVVIEGIAVLGEDILLGLRSPCIVNTDGTVTAQLLRVSLTELFDKVPPSAARIGLPLGDNVGVRDLAAVQGGVLILAGRSDDDRGAAQYTCGEIRAPPRPMPSVWFWDGASKKAKPLGALPGVDASDSAETLLVLDETDSVYHVLIMFDGVEDGAPVAFTIKK